MITRFAFFFQAEGWISEKVQTASDESYRDPTNLQSKLQKHQAFEAELSANKGRVDSVRQVKYCNFVCIAHGDM